MARKGDLPPGLILLIGIVAVIVFILKTIIEFIVFLVESIVNFITEYWIYILIALVSITLVSFIIKVFILQRGPKRDTFKVLSDRIQLIMDKRVDEFKKQKQLLINRLEKLEYYSPGKNQDTVNEESQIIDSDSPLKLDELAQILDPQKLNRRLDIWYSLTDKTEFKRENPIDYYNQKISSLRSLSPPDYFLIEEEPKLKDYQQNISVINNILILPRIFQIAKTRGNFKYALNKWNKEIGLKKQKNEVMAAYFNSAEQEISQKIDLLRQKYEVYEESWQKSKNSINNKKSLKNKAVNDLKTKYFDADPIAIQKFNDKILASEIILNTFPTNHDLQYNPNTKSLLVEYQLPNLNDIPTLKELRYIKTRNEFKEIHINELEQKKLYDSVIYKIALRIIYSLFLYDEIEALDCIVFNGWTEYINKATGFEETSCIVSILVLKGDFSRINLAEVDPKECFKSLKGISCSVLSTMTPIKPIQELDKKDKRFIESRNIDLDTGTNIAAMNWDDFEHLIRELFEKEFKTFGGEVKVTQASRDGGVDAVAFDPDPIRGGKIIIQAKRYTNTVGLASVRDLYGTVINEGATKGILVTTADYGPDAYNFAKDKPLTLLNGSNLLHLLDKHGHNVKIDINEAKRILKQVNPSR